LPWFSRYFLMVSAQLAQVIPSTFHCTLSILQRYYASGLETW
jgi:hypothetical protein